jgi:putative FmdB family regulatory protein
MPLYEFLCLDCGKLSEVLLARWDDLPQCDSCGSQRLKKMISAHSTLSGSSRQQFPGPGDTACCGSSPANAECAGPGSCCGNTMG